MLYFSLIICMAKLMHCFYCLNWLAAAKHAYIPHYLYLLTCLQGHTIGHAMTGSGGQQAPVEQYQAPAGQQPQQQYNNPCQFELDQFIECSKNQSDLSICYGFNEALKECRIRFGKCVTVLSLCFKQLVSWRTSTCLECPLTK